MQFKEAAYEILKHENQPLHYLEITEIALNKKMLDTEGATPGSSMGAMLYTDTLKPDSRFRRGEVRGTFALKSSSKGNIQTQIQTVQTQFRKELKTILLKIHPQKFEELIRSLLEQMGFEEAKAGPYINDKGVDVRGILRTNALSEVKVAIQAKRWAHNVGSGVVRDLRGSLKVADSEQGIIISPSDFSVSAINEAVADGKTPIRLINGDQLIDLLILYNLGVNNQTYVIPTLDTEFWSEVIELDMPGESSPTPPVLTQKSEKVDGMSFPIAIQASHNGQTYNGELLGISGQTFYNGKVYPTPTTAAKEITTDWKSVNGWDFWRFLDNKTGKLTKIGRLQQKSKSTASPVA